ncbi:CCA tRNA nucleotidyltransferase [Streptococcus oricebi]|uniref:CCA-adding enzyme n=1 Tax=Streptococcus oricebi TaxID=1547447 RepID=A0ABS5B3S7_9STRE|nr:CCA tRNA nucleotidyltransferase [Streptococcus oricebi]MBP2623171.1 CCA tRNA nucleotidyltransferase [Streptococcus oricebi]
MRLKHLPSEFQEALPILKKIKAAGFEAYFVGGSVRDALLNRPIHDVDIASSSYPQEIKQIFPRTIDVGIEHGTVLVLDGEREYEVTTFRTEDTYVDYRRPSQVSFVRSLEEDLKRRDFTINALALDEEGNLIDKFAGLADLEQQVLRAVGIASERFNEDALRVMRGFRFQASLGFKLEENTRLAMTSCAPLLEKISVERVFIEFDKLLAGPFWRRALLSLIESGAYHYLPGLKDRGQALEQLLEETKSDTQFKTSEQAWASLILALDLTSARPFLKAWKTSNDFQKKVEDLVSIYRIRQQGPLEKKDCYRFSWDLLELAEQIRQEAGLEVNFDLLEQTYQSLAIHDKQEIVVNGRLLIEEFNIQPGPDLGRMLKELELAIVEDRIPNEKDAIMKFIKELDHE